VWALGVYALVAGVVGTGCFKGDFANCKVTCATSSDCPGGLQCNANGICSVGGNACSAMPDADLAKPQPLTVTKTGDGTITSEPAGIDCGTTCMAEFPPLSSVTLNVTPSATSVFEGWTGDCAGSTNSCSLTMDGAKTAGAQFALHGARRWVKQISFSGQDMVGAEIAVDGNGDVFVATSINDQDMDGFYIAKYAKDTGDILWEKKTLMPGFFHGFGGLDTDSDGNVYMCARLQGGGATTLGTSTVTGDIFGNVLVARFAAADGNIDWAKSWGGSSQEECDGLAVSGTNIFVVGGTSSMPATFDGISLTGQTNYGFIVRASTTNGVASAGKILAGNFNLFDIEENAGQIGVVGSFTGLNVPTDSCNMSSSGSGTDGFIMNFNTNVQCTWSKVFGSTTSGQQTSTYAVAPVPGGGWVTTGSFEGSVNFAGSGSSVGNAGGRDAFIAKWSATGAHVWSFGYGSSGNDTGRGVAVTPTGETIFTGEFSNTITFGTHSLMTTNSDIFITRMSQGVTPTHEWAVRVGGTAGEFTQGAKVNADGPINVITGWSGMTDVDGMPLTAQDYDGWVGSFVR
jgi:hypothetical protein